jgi:hypothetical protein
MVADGLGVKDLIDVMFKLADLNNTVWNFEFVVRRPIRLGIRLKATLEHQAEVYSDRYFWNVRVREHIRAPGATGAAHRISRGAKDHG